MFGYGFLSFSVMLSFMSTYAMSSADYDQSSIKEALHPFVMQCGEEFGVTEDQLEEAKKTGNADDIDPCFMSCFLKKAEFFDSQGKLDVEKTMSFGKAHIKSEQAMKFLEIVSEECVKVNDENVSDGDKGCDRAKLLFDCIQELKKKVEH